MITIALDEAGKFEKNNNSKATFIGGVIYDDKDYEKDTALERKRIEKFYMNVLAKLANENSSLSNQFIYPKALHSDGNKKRDHEIIRPVKNAMTTYLPEFLKNGTFAGKPVLEQERRGEYYAFCLLKSDRGMTLLMDEDVNFMLRDDFASNLYYHMTNHIVERIVFNNPYIDVSEVSFNIATRATGNLNNPELVDEYEKLKHKTIDERKKNIDNYAVGSSDSYRATIAEKMLKSQKERIIIKDFSVNSIQYKNEYENLEFLYLSDSICSMLSYPNEQVKSYTKWLNSIERLMDDICGSDKSLLFLYDDIDVAYGKIWDAYQKSDYYAVYAEIYAAETNKDASAKYYSRKWFRYIESLISKKSDYKAVDKAIIMLNESTRTNTFEQDKAIYIYNQLKGLISNKDAESMESLKKEIAFNLYDAGISLYNHIGKSREALKCLETCKQYADVVSVPKYMSLLAKGITARMDLLEFEEAVKLAKKGLGLSVKMAELKPTDFYKDVSVSSDNDVIRANSVLGQALSFAKSEDAAAYFKEALGAMEEGTANYKITQSYLIHHYIEMGNKEGYQDEILSYFNGISGAKERFDFIIDKAYESQPIFLYKFALLLYLKGLYTFEIERINSKLRKKLYSIADSINQAKKRNNSRKVVDFSGHPVELIYKYIALIACYYGENEEAEKYMNLIDGANYHKGAIIELINKFSYIECFDALEDKDKMNEAINDAFDYARNKFYFIKKKDENLSVEEKYELLKEKIVYMYH